MSFIYGIQNKINGKWYIGKTTRDDVGFRWKQHITDLINNNHYNQHLQNAWNKYGSSNFNFTIISEFPSDFNHEELSNIEIRTIALYDSFKNGYNQTMGGDGRRDNLYFKYTVTKYGKTHQNKQLYSICDRNGCALIRSLNKEFLEEFLPLLNSDEESGLKVIKEVKNFKYTVTKRGFDINNKQVYCIDAKNHKSVLICGHNKDFLLFVMDLLNNEEDKWVIKENNKYKLKNKKLLKKMFKEMI